MKRSRGRQIAGALVLSVVLLLVAIAALRPFGGDEDACDGIAAPSRGELVYVRDNDIWAAQADGADPRRITDDEYRDANPALAPEGCRVVFVSDRDAPGNPNVYSRLINGTEEELIAPDVGMDRSDPAWSPDGQRIAFTDDFFLRVADAGGDESEVLLSTMFTSSPTWSPDGERILFSGRFRHSVVGTDVKNDLWTIRPDGTDLRRLTDTPAFFEADPDWSPDGRLIAFNGFAGLDRGIWVMKSDAQNRRRLTRGEDTEPSWGPDSESIAFTRLRVDRYSIRVVSLGRATSSVMTGLPGDPLVDWLSPPEPAAHPDTAGKAFPSSGPPQPRPIDSREAVRRADRMCADEKEDLGRLAPPDKLRGLYDYAHKARRILDTSLAKLQEIQLAVNQGSLQEFIGLRALQVAKLAEIEQDGEAIDRLTAQLIAADYDALGNRARNTAREIGMEACSRTTQPKLSPRVGGPPLGYRVPPE